MTAMTAMATLTALATFPALATLSFFAVVAVGDASGDVRHRSRSNLPSAEIGSKKLAIGKLVLLRAH